MAVDRDRERERRGTEVCEVSSGDCVGPPPLNSPLGGSCPLWTVAVDRDREGGGGGGGTEVCEVSSGD